MDATANLVRMAVMARLVALVIEAPPDAMAKMETLVETAGPVIVGPQVPLVQVDGQAQTESRVVQVTEDPKAMLDLPVGMGEMANPVPRVLQAPVGPLASRVLVVLRDFRDQRVTLVTKEPREIKEAAAYQVPGVFLALRAQTANPVAPAEMAPMAGTARTAFRILSALLWPVSLNCLSTASASVLAAIWAIPTRFFPKSHPAVMSSPSVATILMALLLLSAPSAASRLRLKIGDAKRSPATSLTTGIPTISTTPVGLEPSVSVATTMRALHFIGN